ncbi:hypothetical protein [Streptomyces sp. NPDC056387]|uniref:hypothetical protein n=1 Tax=Streptomyces sp. NPDC056387 TaxID=3345803 RepID=UPI0035D6FC73
MALRVLFALLPVLSCGFLGWGTMLRLAAVTRKPRDWWLLGLNCLLTVVWVALIGADPTPNTDGWQGNTGAFGVILTGFATCVYFLVADIRHHEALAVAARAVPWYPAQPAPYVPPQQQPRPAYGYPPVQQTPAPTPTPNPNPAPGPATPPRIGQVRAELDELSELLRKQTPHPQANPNPNPPGHEGEGPAR